MASMRASRATGQHIEAIAALCEAAARDRTSLACVRREPLDPAAWIAARLPLVIVEDGPLLVGFAVAVPDTGAYGSPRCAELVAYVNTGSRRQGAARKALADLFTAARTMGLWKLIAFGLSEDAAERALLTEADFREVGLLDKHVQLQGSWRSVAVYEKMLLAGRRSLSGA